VRTANILLARQQALGNQTTQRFAQFCPLSLPILGLCPFGGACHTCPAQVQTKLKIGQPGDKYEQEADPVADQIMRMPERPYDSEPLSNSNYPSTIFLRRCSSCHTPIPEEEMRQERTIPGCSIANAPHLGRRINALRRSGQPLPISVRRFFEPRFGWDFSGVRVHAGPEGESLSREIQAKAFTMGNEVVFGAGAYAFDTHEGKRLLAHELAHVVQESLGPADNSIVHRDVDTRPTRQNPISGPLIRDCTFIQRLNIRRGIIEAASMAGNARALIEVAIAGYKPWVRTLAESHFGHPLDVDTLKVIARRYAHIENTLGLKTYTCQFCIWPTEGHINPDHHTCALGECQGDDITICQQFGEPGCPPGPVIIHEGAHNDGACLDIRRQPGNYPPKPVEGVNNAYSYEYFAVEAADRAFP
jgi:hypothetical protein